MIVRHHARRVALMIRRELPAVRRVLVARTDGQPFFDDAEGADDSGGSTGPLVAAVVGIGLRAAYGEGLGPLAHSLVRGQDGCLVCYPAGDGHLLAVVTDPTVNLPLLDRVMQRMIAELMSAESGVARTR